MKISAIVSHLHDCELDPYSQHRANDEIKIRATIEYQVVWVAVTEKRNRNQQNGQRCYAHRALEGEDKVLCLTLRPAIQM